MDGYASHTADAMQYPPQFQMVSVLPPQLAEYDVVTKRCDIELTADQGTDQMSSQVMAAQDSQTSNGPALVSLAIKFEAQLTSRHQQMGSCDGCDCNECGDLICQFLCCWCVCCG